MSSIFFSVYFLGFLRTEMVFHSQTEVLCFPVQIRDGIRRIIGD
jgi:hypothetical protein